jgi:methyl-branched lipid omega-hydroxylase
MGGSMTGGVCLADPALWLRPDREEVFAQLRREQPVSWQEEPPTVWSPGGRGYWAVLSHEDVRAVSKEGDVFASASGTELVDLPQETARLFSGLINMDDPEHAAMRAIFNAAFTPRQIKTLEALVRTRAVEILDGILERGSCNFATDVADALPAAVICDLLGVPESDRARLAQLSRATHPLGDPEFGTFDDALGAAKKIIAYGETAVADRITTPGEDLLDSLATAVADERLTLADAGTYFMVMVTAGIETTGASIAHGLLALDERPDTRDAWRADFDGLAYTAVEEILRWSTPVVHFRRTATQDVVLGGQPIKSGDKVVLFYNAANRDEAVFADPDRFDISRRPNPHVTFGGGGVHFCLGAHLSRLEIKVMFKELFERVPDIHVSEEPRPTHSMFFNGFKALQCEFTPRRPQPDEARP